MDRVEVEAQVGKVFDAAVEQLREGLIELGGEVAEGEATFFEAEKRFTAAMMVFARKILAALLSLYDVEARYIKYGDEVWRRGTKKAKKVYLSVWGELLVWRFVFLKHGESGGEQLVPLEKRAGLIEGSWTPQTAEAVSRLVQSTPPREAVENVAPLGLLPYCRSTFERIAHTMGQRWEADRDEFEDELIEVFEVPEEATGISVAYDRVRVAIDETERDEEQWPNGREQPREINGRMAYCATVTLHDDDGGPLWTKRYGRLAEQDKQKKRAGAGEWIIREQVLWDVKALIDQKPALEERAVVLTDGGPELERVADEDFPDWPKLCDLRHLASKLSEALEGAGFGPEFREAKRKRWVDELQIYSGAIRWVEEDLKALEGEGVDDALTYIDNRRKRMDYAAARTKNLPVASGHVEATCKSLVAVRMKRSGQRWTPKGGQAVLNLRALALSDQWSEGAELLLESYRDDSFQPCEKPRRRRAA